MVVVCEVHNIGVLQILCNFCWFCFSLVVFLFYFEYPSVTCFSLQFLSFLFPLISPVSPVFFVLRSRFFSVILSVCPSLILVCTSLSFLFLCCLLELSQPVFVSVVARALFTSILQ